MCFRLHALTLSGNVSGLDILHNFKIFKWKCLCYFWHLSITSLRKWNIYWRLKMFCLLEHLLFIGETFPSILPRKKIIRHFKNIFSFDSVINILSGTYQPLFCLLSPSYGNRKFYYAHAYLAMITPILCINSTLTGGLVFSLIMNFHWICLISVVSDSHPRTRNKYKLIVFNLY